MCVAVSDMGWRGIALGNGKQQGPAQRRLGRVRVNERGLDVLDVAGERERRANDEVGVVVSHTACGAPGPECGERGWW